MAAEDPRVARLEAALRLAYRRHCGPEADLPVAQVLARVRSPWPAVRAEIAERSRFVWRFAAVAAVSACILLYSGLTNLPRVEVLAFNQVIAAPLTTALIGPDADP
ncbi:MAG TPA: hypothetical protein VL359_09200 [bacterium]|nr:hypothetical protein [bacterium]